MIEVPVQLGERSYPILIQANSLSAIGTAVKNRCQAKSVAIISDVAVASLYGETVRKSLSDAGLSVTTLTFPEGETSKSYQELMRLHTMLLEASFKRDGLIVALGGGITGDLAGFVASTYLRGIDFVQVPTTLLAQVDSSVGGKVGINHPMGKNLIGNFAQPKLVFIDPETLLTLNKREIWAGLGEVIKYGFIWDASLFEKLENSLESLARLTDMDQMAKIIGICCQVKAEVVSKDEKEGGLRRILNFGHTLGHALESATQYGFFKHGEAVVHGMRWAAWVSWQENHISEALFQRLDNALKQFDIPAIPSDITPELLSNKTKLDKKQTAQGLKLVLLNGLGSTIVQSVQSMDGYIEGWFDYVR